MIHLTNDAVQKHSADYGKYENGNKVSYSELQRYLEKQSETNKIDFYNDIYPKMKMYATEAIRSVYGNINPLKLDNSFELFGLDFMIDQSSKVYLIEVNTNPCLEMGCPLLARLIPKVLDNTFQYLFIFICLYYLYSIFCLFY